MPCLLKKPSLTTPGIITFTHNEVLRGLPKKSKKVKQFLINSKKNNKWIFGVHIQGDCSNLNFGLKMIGNHSICGQILQLHFFQTLIRKL